LQATQYLFHLWWEI